ncbi:tetratricopeptide repeat protein [Xylanibacter muris]|uniref:Tetratricopeptide repeat protein n=1 Tax=Xylanibacter muris TaxID=2736290 RepID=A0ABX2AQ39_9BACT|nr:tetratricopeptide repeat protein [Xylanibacter muris]NPD92657.1 tetratricopeptide repeat protein [Xylanibacter muris]
MNLLKALFGGAEESPEEKRKNDDAKRFDMFKFDGVKAARMGNFDYAVRCYEEALKIKDDLEVRDYLSQAFVSSDKLPEAICQLKILAAAEPENINVWIQIARVAYMAEDYDAMNDACAAAMELDSKNPHVHYLYAQAYIAAGNNINAVAMLTKAIALKPDMADACLLRGKTLLAMGDVGGASDDADLLIKEYPESEDVLMFNARVASAQGKSDEAIQLYGRVTEVNPFCADAYRERGRLKYGKGDMAGASEDMQKVMEITPGAVADISGEFSAEGVEHKVRKAYSNMNPLGL